MRGVSNKHCLLTFFIRFGLGSVAVYMQNGLNNNVDTLNICMEEFIIFVCTDLKSFQNQGLLV